MNTVLVACRLLDEVQAIFAGRFALRRLEAGVALHEQTPGCDAVVLSVETRLDARAIASLDASVRAVATYSVGYDHIDRVALAARGIALLNTPDVLSVAVAEAAVLLALGAARRATESIALIRSRQWTGWTPTQLPGLELHGRTAGILGMGRMGREIAQRLRAFGMTIAYHNRGRLPTQLEGAATYCRNADELLEASDVLFLVTPSTPETRGIVNAERIARMKSTAIVVNVGRGNLVDDDALITALVERRIHAAGLDVFNNEPQLDQRYFDLPNVFMMPHIGSSTVEARLKMGEILATGLEAVARGERPGNLVEG